jgi:hypothetical protein
MASNLAASELLKYDWRLSVFLEKYRKKQPFELVGGQKVTFVYDEQVDKVLQKKNTQQLNNLRFRDAKDKIYKLSDIKKTTEFGGKGSGAGVNIEMREIKSLNEQLTVAKNKLKSATVPIKIKNKIYNVAECVKTPGVPKSDFHLIDINGKEVVWISHKEGRTPKDFQQWGGMSEKEAPVYNHSETQAFIRVVQAMFPEGITPATTVARRIKDTTLQAYSVYGIDYGKELGRQNVSLVLQGPVKLEQQGKFYTITANHAHENGEELDGGFEPVFMAIYKGDRDNFGVKGARFGISPLESRKITKMV